MRRSRVTRVLIMLCAVAFVAVGCGDSDNSSTTEVNDDTVADGCPIESRDGLSLYIASPRTGSLGGNDIWAADRASKSPYNTYQVTGLPPGPIGNPGESAIQAAAQPAPGPWLYFVTVDPTKGTTKFAVTYEEHQANVAEFQKWCQANKGQC